MAAIFPSSLCVLSKSPSYPFPSISKKTQKTINAINSITSKSPVSSFGKCSSFPPSSFPGEKKKGISGKSQKKTGILSFSRILVKSQAQNDKVLGDNGGPISLGTMELAGNVDIGRMQSYMFQWATSLTQNANLPLPAPLKVDRIDDGVRLAYIRVRDGETEPLVIIDVTISNGENGKPAMFRAVRDGPFKEKAPPGEAEIMGSMRVALIKALSMSRIE